METLTDYFTGYLIAKLVGVVIVYCIFGVVTKKINENKGYDGGFAWGFFLGVIGIIVVACRSDAPPRPSYSDRVSKLQEISEGESSTQQGWRCDFCRRVNSNYKTTCECGKSWQCKFCRRVNPNYITTCECGKRKAESM